MNPNDQEFFDLAMKVIAHQASPEQKAELEALLARQSELKTEFDRLKETARLAKEVLPLLAATEATGAKVPAYAQERLQTKVRETFKKAAESGEPTVWESLVSFWRSRWRLSLATAAAVVLLGVLVLPALFRSPEALLQLAVMDVVGGVRGSESNAITILQATWNTTNVLSFSKSPELKLWLDEWPAEGSRAVVKIVYDRDAGEVRVSGRCKGKPPFAKTFPVAREQDLAQVLREAGLYSKDQTSN